MAACLVGAAPPLWVNGKPDSTNPRKGCTAVVGALRPELFVVLAGVQVNESHPLASEVLTPLSLKGRASALIIERLGGWEAVACCLLREPSLPRSVTSLLSSVHEAVKRKRERGGYNAGVVAIVCHEVPIDKGTSESSLLGAGSPLPSIPLHSIVSYWTVRIRPETSIEWEKGIKL